MSEQPDILEFLISSSPNSIIAIDARGTVTVFNMRAEELFGYRAEELLGHSITSLYLDPEEPRKVLVLLQHNNGKLRNYPTMVKDRDGRRIPIRLTATWLPDENGERKGSLGYFEELVPTSPDSARTIQPQQNTRLNSPQALRVFLCHSSGDQPAVRQLYKQ